MPKLLSEIDEENEKKKLNWPVKTESVHKPEEIAK